MQPFYRTTHQVYFIYLLLFKINQLIKLINKINNKIIIISLYYHYYDYLLLCIIMYYY
jgi:hypothetical protein